MAELKKVVASNGRTIVLWSGFNQSGFTDGSVCRLNAHAQAEVSSITNCDVSQRKNAVQNVMLELLKAFDIVYKTSLAKNEYDFQSGKFGMECVFTAETQQAVIPQAQAQVPQQIAVPTDIKPIVPTNSQLKQYVLTAKKSGMEQADILAELLRVGNTQEVAEHHAQLE